MEKDKCGAFIAQRRKGLGMTQKELAAKLFVTDKAVSKWENGGGLPDVATLPALAQALDVTVEELLAGEQQKAVGMNDFRKPPQRKSWLGFAGWIAAAAAEVAILCMLGQTTAVVNETTLTMMALCGGFAVYFWLFAPEKLPSYYDQNRIGSFSDGPLRMNVPGVRFTNRNWPHIVKAMRYSLCALMLLCPLLGLYPSRLLLLISVLCGIFIPVYAVGKKYE